MKDIRTPVWIWIFIALYMLSGVGIAMRAVVFSNPPQLGYALIGAVVFLMGGFCGEFLDNPRPLVGILLLRLGLSVLLPPTIAWFLVLWLLFGQVPDVGLALVFIAVGSTLTAFGIYMVRRINAVRTPEE